MAGSLIKIAETTVSSATASVSLVGIDSTFDVYKVVYDNVQCDTDAQNFRIRVTKSGSADTTSNYDQAYKKLDSSTTFGNRSNTNQSYWETEELGTATQEQNNGVLYLFNFNNSSEYSFITVEESTFNTAQQLTGRQGGGVHTVASASDGIQFLMESGNIDNGTFTLYGLKK
tara:strand:+ start:1724 stop:2239 length:516 start_codon:yes stop_codon:yes gene_type:complete